jgi:hypothetical protein
VNSSGRARRIVGPERSSITLRVSHEAGCPRSPVRRRMTTPGAQEAEHAKSAGHGAGQDEQEQSIRASRNLVRASALSARMDRYGAVAFSTTWVASEQRHKHLGIRLPQLSGNGSHAPARKSCPSRHRCSDPASQVGRSG